jgi:hypothetical protein
VGLFEGSTSIFSLCAWYVPVMFPLLVGWGVWYTKVYIGVWVRYTYGGRGRLRYGYGV